MHQCLHELQELLNSDISEAEFDRIIEWNKEIIRSAMVKKRRIEIMLEAFMKDRNNINLYSSIVNALRIEIQASKDKNLIRHEELKAIRNRIYQYKPFGYISPGRSANFDM